VMPLEVKSKILKNGKNMRLTMRLRLTIGRA
jgi:hypothetical protein